MTSLDHLLLGTSDLAAGVDWIVERLGAEPVLGGRHERWGTANYLLSLGPDVYLEILGPDPDATPGHEPRLFGIEDLAEPKLVTWAARGTDLASLVTTAHARGVGLGAVRPGSRLTPEGAELTWEITDAGAYPHDGLVPFFIDWGDTPHPAGTTPPGGELLSMIAEHPDPSSVRAALAALDLDLPVVDGPGPALVALIRTPDGREVELR